MEGEWKPLQFIKWVCLSLTKLNEELLGNIESIEECKVAIEREISILNEKVLEEEKKQEEARQKGYSNT